MCNLHAEPYNAGLEKSATLLGERKGNYMAINKTTNPNLPWQVDWVDSGRKRRRKSFATKREAEAFNRERKARAAVTHGSTRTHERKTVRQLHALWWEEACTRGGYGRQALAPKTAKHWAWVWERYVAPRWAYTQCSDVTREDIAEWAEAMPAVSGGGVAGSRVRQEALRILRKILDHGVQLGFLDSNPALNHQGRMDHLPHHASKEKSALSYEQLTEFSEVLGKVDPSYKPLVMLMGTSGPRPSEALALRPADFFEPATSGRIVSIERSLGEDLTTGPVKNRKARRVPVFKRVWEMLPLGGDPQAPIFHGRDSQYLRLDNFRKRAWRDSLEVAKKNDKDFPSITPHDLRHTAISLAIANGAPVHVIQKVAGHAKLSTTLDVYGHLLDQEAVKAMQDVEDRLDARSK